MFEIQPNLNFYYFQMQNYKKRALLILYYWPPEGGVGVRRWLKFSKHLVELGWEVTVFTAKKQSYLNEDKHLEKDIHPNIKTIKCPIWEPYIYYNRLSSNTSAVNTTKIKTIISGMISWIRANIFIPDARMFWIFPSIKYLNRELKHNPVDIIISSSTPHSSHIIGMYVAKKNNIPWISDFRDPWTQYYFLQNLPNSKLTLYIHRRLEKSVLRDTSLVITVSDFLRNDFLNRGAKNAEVILNGFDEEDFNISDLTFNTKFTLIHAGSLEFERNPSVLWEIIASISSELPHFKEDLRINLIGKIDDKIIQQMNDLGLSENLFFSSHKPHEEIIPALYKSHILLLPIPKSIGSDRGIMPGKMYEYLRVGGTILAIGPTDGDAAKLISDTKAGKLFDFNDLQGIKTFLIEKYHLYKENKFERNQMSPLISSISRKEIANKLSNLMSKLVNQNE